jgi:hypothetical protein
VTISKNHCFSLLADGGFDALPNTINSYLTQPDTYIYACTEEDTLQALLCCQLRAHLLYIWGARTRDIYQGKGLAKMLLVRKIPAIILLLEALFALIFPYLILLQRHAEAEAARLYSSDATTVATAATAAAAQKRLSGFLSTTITENAPMRRIFNLHGYLEHCLVDIVSLTAENIKAFKGKTFLGNGGGGADAAATILQHCTSVTDLQLALQTLRHHRKSKLESTSTNNTSNTVPEWLPGEYIPWLVESDQVASFINEKKVFMLYSSNFSDDSTYTASMIKAVIFIGMGDHGSPFAGIVAADWSSLVTAIEHALELENECKRLYIDRCGAIAREYLEDMCNGALRDYIVVYKAVAE